MRKKGFTLVELSIVLVIIGLLIGGILVAQSLIESAKINKFIRTIAQYDAMAELFKDRYRKLPGDTTLVNPAGNGDGFLADANQDNVHFSGEYSNFWKHLSDTGFIKNTSYSNDGSDGIHVGTDVPAIELSQTVGLAICTGNGFLKDGHYVVAKFLESDEDDLDNALLSIKATEALAIEGKLDDGQADAGVVQSS